MCDMLMLTLEMPCVVQGFVNVFFSLLKSKRNQMLWNEALSLFLKTRHFLDP